LGKKQVITDIAILSIGAISTFGTVMMTAVPFSIAPSIHKSGIGFYFFGVVFLQTLIGIKELRIKKIPRILPILSFIIVICFLIFFTLFLMLEAGYVDRSTPIFWEWMCYISSIVWLMGHTLVLGKDDNMHLSAT
jgi:hypothetical protein